jgi:phosphoadenosine phosphosulfate reductase
MSVLCQAFETVQHLATRHDAALVAFSGGKDSRAVMDMARRSFRRVVGLFMYFVPGLDCDRQRLEIAEQWGIEVVKYPHFTFLDALREGTYCWGGIGHSSIPRLTRQEIYDLARFETGIRIVLTGIKSSDSLARRNAKRITSRDVYHPIIKWKDFDVLAYCGLHGIPLPQTPSGQRSSGVDLRYRSLLWLHEHYPDDWQRLLQWFPFAEAVLWREKWFYGGSPGPGQPVCEVHASKDPPLEAEGRPLQPAGPDREGEGQAQEKP